MNKLGAGLVGATVAFVGACAVGGPMVMASGSLFGGGDAEDTKAASCGSTATTQKVARSGAKVAGFTAAQTANAAAIVRTGQDMNLPPRGWVVAVATAMQESGLRNYANSGVPSSMALPHEAVGHDHDSVGLFQQRPHPPEGAGSWGTVRELMTPATSARKFYNALLKVGGWQSMPLTRAAQRVQRSAYPSAYADDEAPAGRLVDALSGGAARTAINAPTAGKCATRDQVTAGGWVRPVNADVGSGFRTSDRPGHDGVDLIVGRGTPIKAVAAGTVVHMECDRSEDGYDCNRDGSPSQPGCGWYVDIRHAAGVVTRYCHQLRRPLVSTGDKVSAGQQIGVVGTSGHSSGPHLHFEVHLRGDRSSAGAVNPVPFMREHGAPLDGGASKNV